ncbi:MAG: copper homeostasis protein CutC [Isosphaeraceae bacterium]
MTRAITVEICVADLDSALDAARGGADRIELCDNLAVGGTTPSAGTIAEACARLSVPVHVLIRPRAGDFLPSDSELSAMRRDIDMARTLGAAGVVLGVLRRDARIDAVTVASLVERARPMSVTFHKAFDQVPEPEEALETLIALGVDRVLTSGCRPTAEEGTDVLHQLVRRSAGRIAILVGGRLTLENLPRIVAETGTREIHLGSAVARTVSSAMEAAPADGSELSWPGVEPAKVRRVVDLVRGLPIES